MCLGIPAQIIELSDPEASIATAEISGIRRRVSVALCPQVTVDDWVLVHVGFALATIDEDEAQATLALLHQMGEAYERELAELAASSS